MSLWSELRQYAETIAHQAQISVSWLSVAEEMVFLSEAQHQLQMQTGVCKRQIVIDLSTLASDGSVLCPLGLKSITMATYQPTLTQLSPRPIKPIGWDYFQQLV